MPGMLETSAAEYTVLSKTLPTLRVSFYTVCNSR